MSERAIGIAAVQAAARLCQAVRAEMVRGEGASQLDKEDRSPVTVADFGAQALICRLVGEAFPHDAIVGEESSHALQAAGNAAQLDAVLRFVGEQGGPWDAPLLWHWIDRGGGEPTGRYWVVDPIDGTKGFLRNDQYAIALALIEDGQVQWGFLGCPALPYAGGTGLLFVAQRGAGAAALALDGTPLGPVRVSTTHDPVQARLAESVEAAHTHRGLLGTVKERLGITHSVRMDSQAKYGLVASGQADIYLRAPNPRTPNYRENIWDHAAGVLLVEEAGGTVTDIHGRPFDWNQGRLLTQNLGILATNGPLHAPVLAVIGEALGAGF